MATQMNGRPDAYVIAASELLCTGAVEVDRLVKTYPGGIEGHRLSSRAG